MAPILLVIDLQQGIVEGPASDGPRSTPDLTTNVNLLLSTFRHHHYPILHINHHSSDPTHSLNKDINPSGHAPHPCSAPQGTEEVLVKTAGSAFTDPELRLEDRIIEFGGKGASVVIIGMDGAQCINDNARGASDRGFDVTVVADACATYGMPHYRAGDTVIGAEETHVAAMSMLANGFAKVVMTKEFLRGLTGGDSEVVS